MSSLLDTSIIAMLAWWELGIMMPGMSGLTCAALLLVDILMAPNHSFSMVLELELLRVGM